MTRRLRFWLARHLDPGLTNTVWAQGVGIRALQDDKKVAVDALLLIESCSYDGLIVGPAESLRTVRIATDALDLLEVDRSRAREVA